jgi:hypothetical protein
MVARRWIHASPAFVQFDVGNPAGSGRKECTALIEEAAAYVSNGIEEVTGRRCEDVVFTGGASKGVLWPQILADALPPVTVPRVKESTASSRDLRGHRRRHLPRRSERNQAGRGSRATIEPDAKTRQIPEALSGLVRLYAAQLALVEDGSSRRLASGRNLAPRHPPVVHSWALSRSLSTSPLSLIELMGGGREPQRRA